MTEIATRSPRTSAATVTALLWRGVAVGIFDQVGDDLAHEKVVDGHRGQPVGDVHLDRATRQRGAQPGNGLANEIEDRPGLAVYLEHSGLEPGHVEKTGDQAGETVGLDVDEAVQLVGVGIGEGEGAVEQGRGGHLHGRQGCAQVVRHGAEKGTPEAVHLLEQFRAQRLFSQLSSLHSYGGVIGEGSKQGPIGGRRRQAPNG